MKTAKHKNLLPLTTSKSKIMSLFRNKYLVESARLNNWNYNSIGAYFITICTKNRTHFFGNIVSNSSDSSGSSVETPCMASLQTNPQNQIILSKIGQIVQKEWLMTPQIRPDMNLSLGEFIIMPNHFHAILIIGENKYNKQTSSESSVETPNMASLQSKSGNLFNETPNMASLPGPQQKNVPSIIRGFKSAVTVQARMIVPDFGWQPRFYDHLIRNNKDFGRIQKYIINNPNSWNIDKFKN